MEKQYVFFQVGTGIFKYIDATLFFFTPLLNRQSITDYKYTS